MDLLLIALALFIGMIVCWCVLPSSPTARVKHYESDAASHGAARQLA